MTPGPCEGGSGFRERLFSLPLKHPFAVVFAVLGVSLAAAWLWPSVRFEPDVSRVLPADHEHVKLARLLDERARPQRSLWLLVKLASPASPSSERSPSDHARRVAAIAESLGDSPLVLDVAATRSELFRDLFERAAAAPLWSLDQAAAERLVAATSRVGVARAVDELLLDLADDPIAAREVAARDPLGLRWVLSQTDPLAELGFAPDRDELLRLRPDGSASALIRLRGQQDAFDATFSTELCGHVERCLEAHAAEAVMFGGYAVARADQQRLRADFERASTWSVVLIAIYLCWVMRSIRLPLVVQLSAMLSIAWAIPFGAAWLGALPTVAVAAVAVLCGLGVDFSIHYAARYRSARLHLSHRDAVALVQRTTVPELLIDMATTAVTFLAIGFGAGASGEGGASGGGLRAFGLLLALGLVFSVLCTVFLLPVLLQFVGDRRDPERSMLASYADRRLLRASSRRTSWAVLLLSMAGLGYLFVVGVPLSAQPESLRPSDDPIAAARRTLEQEVGFSTVPLLVLWPQEQDASPLLLALEQERAAGMLRFWSGLDRPETRAGRDAVASVRAELRGFVGRARVALRAEELDDEAFAPALAEWRDRLWADPPVAPNPRVVPFAGAPHRVVEIWPTARVDAAAFAALQNRLQSIAGDGAALHGGPTLTAALESMLERDLERAVVVALLLALCMVTLWLRSLRHGLLSLVPSLVGLIATLLLLHGIGVELSMVSFVAVPFVLGIGVDEGVHLVGHFRHMGAAGEGTGAEGQPVSTGATGVGIVRTSVGTVLGFGALCLADSPGLQLLGLVVAFGSMVCMLACLLVLAPLLAARASAAATRDGAA